MKQMPDKCVDLVVTDPPYGMDFQSNDRTGNNLHPTEKPVDLILKIIGANVGDIVLDPFLGSGTTAVAAKQLGRKYIGIELSEKYCQIAEERLKQDLLF